MEGAPFRRFFYVLILNPNLLPRCRNGLLIPVWLTRDGVFGFCFFTVIYLI